MFSPRRARAPPALYDALAAFAPTVGVYVNRAAAHAEAFGAAAGPSQADALPRATVAGYQPWWALRAHLLARLERLAEARVAYEAAAGLAEQPAVRAFLLRRMRALGGAEEGSA